MQNKRVNIRFVVLIILILLAAFSRVIPHMPNFSPLGAIAIFGAAYFHKKWQAFFIPIAATWLSDLYLNNVIYAKYHPDFTWFYSGFYWIYGTYLLIALAGILIVRKVTIGRVIAASLTSTVLFFIITNFICWPGSKMYTQDISGLVTCYAAGLPFIKGTLLGDLFYSAVLFGGFALAQKKFPWLRMERPIFTASIGVE